MIPSWNAAGLMPPVQDVQSVGENRSPYAVDLCEVVEQFSSSAARIVILEGLLNYRAALHGAGLVDGFQWLDGSFMENVELLQQRPPNDLDLVTFFYLPANTNETQLASVAASLFDNDFTKKSYKIDAYAAVLGEAADPSLVKQVAYWYSIWSHNRAGQWKGFLQIPLSPDSDAAARQLLDRIKLQGAGL
jgi:hypothetical protein